MQHHAVHVYGSRDEVLADLRSHASPQMQASAYQQVACMDERLVMQGDTSYFRSPGTFLLGYAQGVLDLDQVYALCEQVQTLTSHDGCGAGGVVFGMVKQQEGEADVRLRAFFGDQYRDDYEQVMAGDASDELAKLWSRVLAERTGCEYDHLTVNDTEHYSGLAVIDLAGLFKGAEVEESGAFVIHSVEDLGADHDTAVAKTGNWGVLAEVIGHGGHSLLNADQVFWVAVVTDDAADQGAQAMKAAIESSIEGGKVVVEIFTAAEVLSSE